MRVLLTGATGFVGSSVLRRLLAEESHAVAALLRPTASPRRIADLLDHDRFVRVSGDMTNLAAVEPEIAAFRPDVVLHLAWAGVGNSRRNDILQGDNVEPALELTRLAHRVGATAWVGLGSQAEYGPKEGVIDETSPTRPTTLYGTAKLCTSMLCGSVCQELGMRFAWLRLFSSYGPDDDPSWMISYLIRSLLAGERPSLTKGEQCWDYIYVTDVAEAVVRVAQSESGRGVYNLGSGEAPTIRTLVETIRDRIDSSLPLGFGEVPYRPDQVMHLQADIGRLLRDVGWSPALPFEEGIKLTVEWHREHRD